MILVQFLVVLLFLYIGMRVGGDRRGVCRRRRRDCPQRARRHAG